MSTAQHIQCRLEVADGRRIGVVLPNEVGGGFDSHCVALAQDSGGRLDAEANARRLVACWNACDGVETDLLESYPEPFSELRAQRDELLAALLAQLDMQTPRDVTKAYRMAEKAIARVRGAA